MRIQRQNETFAWRFAAWNIDDVLNDSGLMQKRNALNFLNKAAHDAGLTTLSMFGNDPNRAAMQDFIHNFWWETGGPDNQSGDPRRVAPAYAPTDRQATVLAGYPGSGKSFALKHPNIRDHIVPSSISNPDPIKYLMMHMGMGATQEQIIRAMQQSDAQEKLAQAGYDPERTVRAISEMPYRFSPGDLSPLMHAEAKGINNSILERILRRGGNVTLDGTFGDAKGEQDKVDLLRDADYDISGILVNASRDSSEKRALQRYAKGDNAYEAGEADDDWYDKNAGPRHGLGTNWMPPSGFVHPLSRHAGGRFVGTYVAPPNPGAPWKGQSHKNFHELMPQFSSAISIDADQDYSEKVNRWGEPQRKPLHIEDGFGDLFDNVMSSGGVYVPRKYAYRVASGSEKPSFKERFRQSARGIMGQYLDGEIDYPTLAHLLVQRAHYLNEKKKTDPPLSYWDDWVKDIFLDDIKGEISVAFYEKAISQQQREELLHLVRQTGYRD